MNTLDQGTNGMISGTESDLGKVMINMTEAQLSLETAVQVRNKVIEAYNDIKNMQF
jgi:flagellar hook-basal body complex protein FliE